MSRSHKGQLAYSAPDGSVSFKAAEPTSSPATGLLLAVGSSLILWAAIAQIARWLTAVL